MNGTAAFADGDVGDFNHEGYAIQTAQQSIMEGEEDWESWKVSKAQELAQELADQELLEETKWELKNQAETDPELFLINHLKDAGIDEDEFLVANDNHRDVRLFSMQKWGWKRMAGREITTWTLTQEDLNSIVRGIDDAYGEEISESESNGEDTDFNLEVLSTKTTYWGIPYSILEKRNIMELREFSRNSMFGPQAKSKFRIYRIAVSSGDQIFGYIDPNDHVESKLVPKKYADTYGSKNGLCHLDLFGADMVMEDANATWRCFSNRVVYWWGNPTQDQKNAVENHLYRKYKFNVLRHQSP